MTNELNKRITNESRKMLLKLAGLGALTATICSCEPPKAYPEGKEWEQEAWLINKPGQRAQFVHEGELFTRLFLDTDGDRSTYEYVAMDKRTIFLSGRKNVYDYRKAVDLLETGECRTLAEWKKVAPNIVKGKYVSR